MDPGIFARSSTSSRTAWFVIPLFFWPLRRCRSRVPAAKERSVA